MRALIVGAVMAGFIASPAYAQMKPPDSPMVIEEQQKKRDAEAVDQKYKSTLEKTNRNPVETRAADPWQNMRGPDDSKAKR